MMDVLCIGHAAFDVTMSAQHHPAADEKLMADAMQLAGGGPAANAAVQVARLGGSAAFCGYLGHDPFGQAHAEELLAEGVDVSSLVRGTHPSPVSQILAKPDGLRSVVTFKCDTPWLAQDAVDFSALQAKAVLFDGHEPLASEAAMAWVKGKHIPTVLDAGSLHRGTEALAGQVDYLVASAKFARQYAGTDDMQQALRQLAGQHRQVVITLGSEGLIWARDGRSGRMPAFAVQALDSTGAGDSFHGAFALAVARRMDWEEMLRFSAAAGALTCSRLGARASLPDAAAVAGLLQAQPLIRIQ
jgi:sulfofructose kinase